MLRFAALMEFWRFSSTARSFSVGFFVVAFFIPTSVFGIRKDIGLQWKTFCKTTVQGRYLLADDNGRVCDAFSVDQWTRCCPETKEQFTCQDCNLGSQCCNSYEYCISCCLDPSKTKEDLALKVKIAKPLTAGTYESVFDFCAGRCRHNSATVVHENAYASEFHHCFGMQQNASGISEAFSEPRLAGLNIVVGRQGESCNSVCKSKGQSCVAAKLLTLNNCEILEKYMNCKGACISSQTLGAEQPAEVVENAPRHMTPGACLYAPSSLSLSCDGSHQYTRRLCPCT